MFQKVILVGNVGADPKVRTLNENNGKSTTVANFSLATSERFRDREGKVIANTEWHNVVAWRGLGVLAEKFIKKGSLILVEGKSRSRKFTGNDGQDHYTTEIVADTIQLLGKKSDMPADVPAEDLPSDDEYNLGI